MFCKTRQHLVYLYLKKKKLFTYLPFSSFTFTFSFFYSFLLFLFLHFSSSLFTLLDPSLFPVFFPNRHPFCIGRSCYRNFCGIFKLLRLQAATFSLCYKDSCVFVLQEFLRRSACGEMDKGERSV